MTLIPILPPWAITLTVVALLVLLVHGCFVLWTKRVSGRWIFYLAILRVLAVVLFALCLLRPVLSRARMVRPKADLLLLVDTSRSMGLRSTESAPTRLEQAVDAMRRGGLLDAMNRTFAVQPFAFDEDARPLRGPDLRDIQPPQGISTRLGQSLATAWQECRQNPSRGPAAELGAPRCLVVTDGNDHDRTDAAEAARRLGLVVYTVAAPAVEDKAAPPAVAIAGVQGNRRVLLGSECRLRLTLRQQGAAGRPLRIEMAEDGQTVMTQDISFNADESEKHVSLAYRPTSAGVKQYELRVLSPDAAKPVLCAPYELTAHVMGRTHRVLVLEDAWRWETRFLRRVLEDDPSFSFTLFLSRGPGIYLQYTEPDSSVKLGGFPQSRAELEWFDVLVLGDVNVRAWPPALPRAINQLVLEEGRSLVVMAGPGINRLASDPYLGPLLPVEITPESARPIAGPVKVRPTDEAPGSPLFYQPRRADTGIRWSDLPDMDQIYAPLRKRPAATVLLEAPDHTNPFGRLIVLAEHSVGRGRALFVGTDTLWRWQTLAKADDAGNTPYQIFWQQALRALAPARWPEGAVDLWLETDRSKYAVGDTVEAIAEFEGTRSPKPPQISARVMMPDGREIPLTLLPDAARSGVARARFDAPAAGHYRLAAEATSEGRPVAESSAEIDVDPGPDELADRGVNTAVLDRLASLTGGGRVDPARPETWPRPAAGDAPPVPLITPVELWASFTLLSLLVLVLAIDWLLRLLRGFV